MLNKKKTAEKVPRENMEGWFQQDIITVENWMKYREFWSHYNGIMVQAEDFVVDVEEECLYVKKTAMATTRNKWGGTRGNVQLWRVHDGWLRADYNERIKFKKDDVKDSKSYFKINLLYKVVKVGNIIKEDWWNSP